jgi:hypothetical protein
LASRHNSHLNARLLEQKHDGRAAPPINSRFYDTFYGAAEAERKKQSALGAISFFSDNKTELEIKSRS